MHQANILIIDFGSQYTQLIGRSVRELGVYAEIHPFTITDETILQLQPQGIILSGGPQTLTLSDTPRAPAAVFTCGKPVLGICYGMQTMAEQLKGSIARSDKREFGYAEVTLSKASALFDGISDRIGEDGLAVLDVWMSHGDQVSVVPPAFNSIAYTNNCLIAAMADETRQFYGLQFHPEVFHTRQGKKILSRFVFDICHCQANWTSKNIIDDTIHHIRQQVGNEKVILGLSGGVDSSVAALLLQKAIGDQLTCVLVDTGLMRLGEVEQIQAVFSKQFGLQLIVVDAQDQFFKALIAVSDPEEKRKIIGKTFIDVFEKRAKELANIKWLAQGTIYSDVIESAKTKTGGNHVIKSHHNVGGLPEKMHLKLIEPLRELFKDEVRKIGIELGLPHDLVNRHPFPGPGLAVRILGEVQRPYVEKLRLADAILIEALHKHNWYDKVSQAFAVYLPVKSVGVMGDGRHYDHVIAIRVVETTDFMTAQWAHLPYSLLEMISNRIINEVPGISRVTYDISSKPPATIEWE